MADHKVQTENAPAMSAINVLDALGQYIHRTAALLRAIDRESGNSQPETEDMAALLSLALDTVETMERRYYQLCDHGDVTAKITVTERVQ